MNSNSRGRLCYMVFVCVFGLASWASAQTAPPPPKPVREIFVPFKDLNAILDKQPQRVLLKREEYLELLAKAKKAAETHAPIATAVVAADYQAAVSLQRVQVTAVLSIDCLEKGVQAMPLELKGLSITRATLDGGEASLATADPTNAAAPLLLFLEGAGRHELKLELVGPVETTASQQILRFQLPTAPSARLRLTAPGDVEIKSGADVVRREVDAAAKLTRFEILPRDGEMAVAMTLNSHLQRQDQAVVANTVAVSEVTQAYEKLHTTVTLQILHKAVDRFRFAVPNGFEILEVSTPLLARWEVKDDGGNKTLLVQLREQTTDPVTLNIAAIRTPASLVAWNAPQLKPLDVAGQVAVIGLLVEDRLRAESIAARELIPIDVMALRDSLPESVLKAAPGAPALRPVAAWYAPDGAGCASANFTKPAAGMAVTSNLVLRLTEQGQEIDGALVVLPEVEKRFTLSFSVPALWHVDRVTAADGKALPFERYGDADKPGRIEVRLPAGIPADQEYQLRFHAAHAPEGWLGRWDTFAVPFPAFAILGATRDEGALAVAADEDMEVRPEKTDNLTPLLEPEKPHYGLAGVATRLAWRYETPQHAAALVVTRGEPRITARSIAFFQVKPEVLGAHCELAYQVEEARGRELTFVLPATTPKAISIRGLDEVRLKETKSDDDGELRRWTVLLEDARRGTIRLAVDFDQAMPDAKGKPVALPMISAEGVAYQSGLAAVEGSADLNVQVQTAARQVDVGELVEADYQPGRRLLGAYGFVGEPPALSVTVDRTPGYALYPALVQSASLDTYLAAEGVSQTEANFTLKTKALLLELKLPDEASLWSATLDGQPIKPQQEGNSLLINFPAVNAPVARQLQFVYDAKVRGVAFAAEIEVPAPKLKLRAAAGAPSAEVPLGDLVWRLHLPTGYKVTRCLGNVTTAQLERPEPAAVGVAMMLYRLAGGVNWLYGIPDAVNAASLASVDAEYGARGGRRGPAPGEEKVPKVYKVADLVLPIPPGAKHEPEGKPASEPQPAAPATPPPASEAITKAPAKEQWRKIDERKEMLELLLDQSKPISARGSRLTEREKGFNDEMSSVDRASIPMDTNLPFQFSPPGGATAPRVPEASAPSADAPRPNAASPKPGAAPRSGEGWYGAYSRSVARKNVLGMRSLKIDLSHTPIEQTVVLRSLGEEPRLAVRLARSEAIWALGAGLAMLTLLWGVLLTRSATARKARFVLAVLVLATVVPFLWLSIEVADVANAVFYAAAALVPYYLLAGAVRWFLGKLAAVFGTSAKPAAANAAAAIFVLVGIGLSTSASAAEPPVVNVEKLLLQLIDPPTPVQVPDEAIVVPFDPAVEEGQRTADRLLVPYAKYVELWNQAYPDRKIDEKPAPAPYAFTGASYRAALAGDDFLLVTGTIGFEVFAEGFVQVPLPLSGGVLARAELDGKPARLQTLEVQPPVAQSKGKSAPAASGGSLAVLHLSGKGRHKLELSVRMKIARQGGWRSIDGAIPNAPAAALALSVPEAQTEVRLGQVADRRSYDTEKPAEEIHTALGPGGRLSIQWRPKVAEGQVDQALTSQSSAILNVEEDGLRLAWRVALDFRRSQRERFTVLAPKDCLIERVEGPNVRGWTLKDTPERRSVEVELLKAAKDREEFTVLAWRAGKVGSGELAEFAVPVIEVADAALSSGEVTVCRSPLLELRTVDVKSASRVDLSDTATKAAAEAAAARPLGVRPFQAYRFATMPFTLRVAAQAKTLDLSATVQSVVKIADIGNTLSSHILLDPKGRPIHEAKILLPAEFSLDGVVAPGEFQWAVTRQGERPLLTVYFAAGRQPSLQPTAVTLRGRLARPTNPDEIPLPQIEVLGAARQEGAVAVQIDPAYDIEPLKLQKCERVLMARLYGWLRESQRAVTRLGIEYREAGYSGVLKRSARKSEVSCETITNVRFTPTAVQETILLVYQIEKAGIRSLAFTLPPGAAGASVSVPMLRQKKALPQADGSVRMAIDLQDDVMGELRVLVRNDRALVRGAECRVPLVTVEGARTNRSYIALESAGRDEVETLGAVEGIELLGRQTKEWQALQAKLGGGNITQAWLVRDPSAGPLAFRAREREAVKTAGAKILLAQAELVVDAAGAYRAQQIYKINNTTEQYLKIQLPQGAELWTARVAAEPVKPKQSPGDGALVRIPLVKTAVGELDYEVAINYGGKMPDLAAISRVEFPLMRVLGIQPEMSLLNLYLPKSHEWAHFGGTMHEVFDAAVLENEKVAYQNKLTQSVLEASRQGDFNTKIRAATSLKILATNSYSGTTVVNGGSLVLKGNLDANGKLMQQAGEEVRKLEESLDTSVDRDNRGRLNDLYEGQKLARARNVVQDVGDNWSGQEAAQSAEAVKAGGGEIRFNQGWLEKNSLGRPVAEGGDRSGGGKDGKEAPKGDKQQAQMPQSNVVWSGKQNPVGYQPIIAQQRESGQQDAKPNAKSPGPFSEDLDVPFQQGKKYYGRVAAQQFGQVAQQADLNNAIVASGNNTLTLSGANAYTGNTKVGQGQLVLNNTDGGFQYGNGTAAGLGGMPANQPAVSPTTPNAPPPAVQPPAPNLGGQAANAPQQVGMAAPGVFSADLDIPFTQNTLGDGRVQQGGLGGMGGGQFVQNPATGLASLEIDLPLRDDAYEVHRFLTPRGDVELRAFAASRDRIASLLGIAAVLAAALAGWGVFRLTRRGAPWITGPYGSTVLLVLGLASLVTGVLPLAGAAAALAGLAAKICRAAALRAPSAATAQVVVAEAVGK